MAFPERGLYLPLSHTAPAETTGGTGLGGLVTELLNSANRGVTLGLVAALLAGLVLKGGVGLVDRLRWQRAATRVVAGLGSSPNTFAATGVTGPGQTPPSAFGGGSRVLLSQFPGALPGAIVVHVAGAVLEPGVYRLEQGARVDDALKAAGGPSDKAAPEAMNLAEVLSDGAKVYVPSRAEVAGAVSGAMGAAAPIIWAAGPVAGGTNTNGGKVNINSATAQTLENLPGVGPSTAAKIIAYRQQYGPFRSADDLKNVPGIGEKKYAELAPFITVR